MKESVEDFIKDANDFLIDLAVALIIVIIGFKIVDLIVNVMKKPHKYAKLDPTVKSFMISFISIALKIFVIVILCCSYWSCFTRWLIKYSWWFNDFNV